MIVLKALQNKLILMVVYKPVACPSVSEKRTQEKSFYYAEFDIFFFSFCCCCKILKSIGSEILHLLPCIFCQQQIKLYLDTQGEIDNLHMCKIKTSFCESNYQRFSGKFVLREPGATVSQSK